ncbi:MAG TPA: C10 family peptidase [Chthoniobacteraceae bacterium]|jgi:hypothetical protein|nr:C10 family peptidase [Chthoniobacteraceae bacterium]
MPPNPFNLLRPGKIAASLALAIFAVVATGRLHAAPISGRDALDIAYAWASLSPEAMHEQHGRVAGTETPILDSLGETTAYAVDLAPKGYVIVAADDSVEPIIAFSTTDTFQAAPANPLYDMVRGDLQRRLARARGGQTQGAAKWRMLRNVAYAPKLLTAQEAVLTAGGPKASSVSDVRVAPLTKSAWNQTTTYGLPVFNYYTPPYGAGNTNNYYAGCVATMLAQLMRFHQWPQDAVGTSSFQITVNGNNEQKALRGGDGNGGSYNWSNMPLVPGSSTTTVQEQAIGSLLVDAGVASNMDYESDGSGAYLSANVLTNTFHYANAAYSEAGLANLEVAIEANLDAGLPVGVAISGGGEGHAVVADGYGYNGGTVYQHINMGWSGSCNAWYNLPEVVAGGYDFNTVDGVLYNIDPQVKGEIVSGRVTDAADNAVSGVTVTAAANSVVYTATTDAEGIYAFKGLTSNTKWTFTPSAQALNFTPASIAVTTGKSSGNGSVGDKTGENFASQLIAGSVTVQINAGAAAAGAEWRVNGGAWQASGATVASVPVGSATLTFRPAKAWTAPASQQVTVTQNQTTNAQVNFAPQYSLVATADNPADGSVSADPEPGDLGSYAPGAKVTLSATAAAGYYFGGWVESGTLVSTDASYACVVKGARTLVANFPPQTLTGQNAQAYVTSNRAADIIDVLSGLSVTSGTATLLSVTQPTKGTVTINPDGTLTFTPASNFRGSAQFSYTAGDGQGGTITRTVTISNWFTASAGTYAGLSMADDVSNGTSGYLKATVTASGAFTGKLTYAGESYPLSGAFNSDASCQKVIARKDASSLTVSLYLDPASEISGTVSDGTNTSSIVADRIIYGAANKAPQAGKYTATLSGTGAETSYLVISVTAGGAVAATGKLADGTVVSTTAYVNPDGSVPFYAGIYKGAGSLLGTLSLQPAGTPQITGSYAWFTPTVAETGTADGTMITNSEAAALMPKR